MTELARHIEILLLDNDCVIVPEFGGFMAHHAASIYSEAEDLFLPPTRTIGFNPQLKLNDSLLVQSYIEAYDISYPEALRRIEDSINEIRLHIENEGFCELANIGTLSLNEENNYNFVPCQSGILTPALYALNSFEMSPLSAVSHAAVAEPESETDEKTIAIGEEETEGKIIRINVTKFKNIAAAAAILLLFMIISSPLGDGKHTNSELCSIDSNILTRIMPSLQVEGSIPSYMLDAEHREAIAEEKEVTFEELTETVDEQKSEPAEEVKLTPAKETAEKQPATYYAIVLAARVSKANADIYVNKLKEEGLNDARINETTGFRKVIYGNYSNEAEAQNALSTLRSKSGFEEAWVVKITE